MADSLTGTPDEVAMCIASCLDSPVDLLRLGVACRQFRLMSGELVISHSASCIARL